MIDGRGLGSFKTSPPSEDIFSGYRALGNRAELNLEDGIEFLVVKRNANLVR